MDPWTYIWGLGGLHLRFETANEATRAASTVSAKFKPCYVVHPRACWVRTVTKSDQKYTQSDSINLKCGCVSNSLTTSVNISFHDEKKERKGISGEHYIELTQMYFFDQEEIMEHPPTTNHPPKRKQDLSAGLFFGDLACWGDDLDSGRLHALSLRLNTPEDGLISFLFLERIDSLMWKGYNFPKQATSVFQAGALDWFYYWNSFACVFAVFNGGCVNVCGAMCVDWRACARARHSLAHEGVREALEESRPVRESASERCWHCKFAQYCTCISAGGEGIVCWFTPRFWVHKSIVEYWVLEHQTNIIKTAWVAYVRVHALSRFRQVVLARRHPWSHESCF